MPAKFRYYEDYQIGLEGITSSRTIGESAIDTFAYITGDHAPEHLDRHGAAQTPYGERIAHGLLGASLVPGMISLSAPHIVGRGVRDAFLRGFECAYRRAIRISDTIRVRWRISEMADDPRSPGFGLITTRFDIVNQDDVAVYSGTLALTVRKGSAADARLPFQPGVPWEIRPFELNPTKAYVLEDYVVGEGQETGGRTITETDVVNFTGLTGDLNPLYVDAAFAKENALGERMVPPMLAFVTALPLLGRDGSILPTHTDPVARTWAGHPGDDAVFLMPVRIGDTLRCRCRVQSLRPSKTKPQMGILMLGTQVVNQRSEVVQEGHIVLTASTRAASRRE